MNHIVKFSNFNESKGISDVCDKVTENIWKNIYKEILNKNSLDILLNINEKELKTNLRIIANVVIGEKNICNCISDLSNANEIVITFYIEYYELDSAFIYYIKSVLLHEMVHVYQFYNIKTNNKFRPSFFSIGSILNQLRRIVKTRYAMYIIDVIYYSLSHEISARLHQYYLYKKVGKHFDEINFTIKLLSGFTIKKMTDKELQEINFIKNHIYNSILHFTDNKTYIKKMKKSLWTLDANDFLDRLEYLCNKKVKWIKKKIKMIDTKPMIDYNETITYYGDQEFYSIMYDNSYISRNIGYIKKIDMI